MRRILFGTVLALTVAFGGVAAGSTQCDASGGGSVCGYLWSLDLSASERSAHVYSVPLVSTGEDFDAQPPTLTNLEIG